MTDEIVVLFGWGPEEEDRISSLLYLVETAAVIDMKVTVFLFIDGVILARKGAAAKISEEIGRRFKVVLNRENVKFYVCEEAARKRNIDQENVEDGVKIVGYITFLDIAVSAKTVITV